MAPDVRKTLAKAMISDAIETLRGSPIVDVSISSIAFGFEATNDLFQELQKAAKPALEVEREAFGSYFTFTRAHKDVEC